MANGRGILKFVRFTYKKPEKPQGNTRNEKMCGFLLQTNVFERMFVLGIQ